MEEDEIAWHTYALKVVQYTQSIYMCAYVTVIESNKYSVHFLYKNDCMTPRNEQTITEGQKWCYGETVWYRRRYCQGVLINSGTLGK